MDCCLEVGACTEVSLFWHYFLGFDCLCFHHINDGTSASFDKQNLLGSVMPVHNKTQWDVVYYYGLDHFQVRAFSWTSRYTIVLSPDLLNGITMMGKIPFSFTKFFTTPELSSPLFISPDIYHTQITEYSLPTFYEWALFSLHRTPSY